MQLTSFSDFALRALIYMGTLPAGELTNVGQISQIYGVSRNHMVKVVNRLGHAGFVTTFRGKKGGICLAKAPAQIGLGEVIRALEPMQLINCQSPSCCVASVCRLSPIIEQATQAFLAVLDQYTLADLLDNRSELIALFALQDDE